MKKLFLILSASLFIVSSSCKQQAGEGGMATIQGKVLERKMNPAFSVCYGQYIAANFKVYIIYGDDVSYGNSTSTGPDGVYQFQYLRKGSYKVYVYSNDSARTVGPPANATAPKMAVSKDVRITSRKEVVDAGVITVYN
jgi:hypothetical protein